MEEIKNRFKRISNGVCYFLEAVMGLLVLIGILIAMVGIWPELSMLIQNKSSVEAFYEFLEHVFVIVIGIEFLKMLCRPNSDNVFETIIFLVARHMIITETTPMEDLVSTVSIVILCFMRRYMGIHLKVEMPFTGKQVPQDKTSTNQENQSQDSSNQH